MDGLVCGARFDINSAMNLNYKILIYTTRLAQIDSVSKIAKKSYNKIEPALLFLTLRLLNVPASQIIVIGVLFLSFDCLADLVKVLNFPSDFDFALLLLGDTCIAPLFRGFEEFYQPTPLGCD